MTKELIIDLNKGENKFKTYAPWIAALVALAVLVAAAGFFLGRWDGQQNIFGFGESKKGSPTREGWLVYETEKYSIEYPESWGSEESDSGSAISKESGQINAWPDAIKHPSFTKEQKANIKATKQIDLEVDGRKASVSETIYKSGEFFLSVLTDSTKEKEKITFWVAANDEETKNEAVEIIKTYQSK